MHEEVQTSIPELRWEERFLKQSKINNATTTQAPLRWVIWGGRKMLSLTCYNCITDLFLTKAALGLGLLVCNSQPFRSKGLEILLSMRKMNFKNQTTFLLLTIRNPNNLFTSITCLQQQKKALHPPNDI